MLHQIATSPTGILASMSNESFSKLSSMVANLPKNDVQEEWNHAMTKEARRRLKVWAA